MRPHLYSWGCYNSNSHNRCEHMSLAPCVCVCSCVTGCRFSLPDDPPGTLSGGGAAPRGQTPPELRRVHRDILLCVCVCVCVCHSHSLPPSLRLLAKCTLMGVTVSMAQTLLRMQSLTVALRPTSPALLSNPAPVTALLDEMADHNAKSLGCSVMRTVPYVLMVALQNLT